MTAGHPALVTDIDLSLSQGGQCLQNPRLRWLCMELPQLPWQSRRGAASSAFFAHVGGHFKQYGASGTAMEVLGQAGEGAAKRWTDLATWTLQTL